MRIGPASARIIYPKIKMPGQTRAFEIGDFAFIYFNSKSFDVTFCPLQFIRAK